MHQMQLMQLQFELNFLKRSIRQGQKNTYFPKRKKNLKELQYPETIHCRNICLTNTFSIKIENFYIRKYFREMLL